ncbi:MAG: dihydroorotase [Chloroflexi bacterium]|nr:dihydroorotase [Chloroflexota bacterium]
MNKSSIGVKNVRIIDPYNDVDNVLDILIENGIITGIGKNIFSQDTNGNTAVIDGTDKILSPGFIDLHTHLRDPGQEHKETIETGMKAAAKGGFTTICSMPNTNPPVDNSSIVKYILDESNKLELIKVLPIGCVTKGRKGTQISEMWDLKNAGCVGFSDDGDPIYNSEIMQIALQYSEHLGLPVINHCEDTQLSKHSSVNEGKISNRLGLSGWPNQAEDIMIARDIELAKKYGGHLHIAHASTARSVELINDAKKLGVNITAEVTPHHLTMTDSWFLGHQKDIDVFACLGSEAYDSNLKVNPPLRTKTDVNSLLVGLKEGIIDAIATDHAPHALQDKITTLDAAEYGINGLETAFTLLASLYHQNMLDIAEIINRLTLGPANIISNSLEKPKGIIKGELADIVLLDMNTDFTILGKDFISKSKLTPLEGLTFKGKVILTVAKGSIVYQENNN